MYPRDDTGGPRQGPQSEREEDMSFRSVSALSAIVVASSALSTANAALITTDPTGLVDGPTSTLVEARARLDKGNSQTWKTALITSGNTIQDTGGNTAPANNPWQNAVPADFSLTYDIASGLTTLTLDWGTRVETAQADILPAPGNNFVGFRFEARSEANSFSILDNIAVSINGSPATLPITSQSAVGASFAQSSDFFFTDAFSLSTFEVTGTALFSWDAAANLQGDRFRVNTRLLQGVAIPTPGAATLACIALLTPIRRRRR